MSPHFDHSYSSSPNLSTPISSPPSPHENSFRPRTLTESVSESSRSTSIAAPAYMTSSAVGAESRFPITRGTPHHELTPSRQQHRIPEAPAQCQQPASSTPITDPSSPSIASNLSPSPSPPDPSSPSLPQSLARRVSLGGREFAKRLSTPINLGSLPSFPFPDPPNIPSPLLHRRGQRDEEDDRCEEVRQDVDDGDSGGRKEEEPGDVEDDLGNAAIANPTTTPSSPLPLRYWPGFPPSPLSPDILLSPLRRPRNAFPFPFPELRHHHARPQTSQHLIQTPPPPPSRALSSPSGSTCLSPWRMGRRDLTLFSSVNPVVSSANIDGASRALWFAAAASSPSAQRPSALSRTWSELDTSGEKNARTSSHLELDSPLALRDWTGGDSDSQDEVD